MINLTAFSAAMKLYYYKCAIAKDTCPHGYTVCCSCCDEKSNCEDTCLNAKEKCGLAAEKIVDSVDVVM